MMLLRTLALLLCLTPVPAMAAATAGQALEQRVEALLGYWFSPGRDASEARVLRITNVIFADAEAVELAGQFGAASAVAWPEARELTARSKAGRIVIDLVSADGARIQLTQTPDGALQAQGKPAPSFARSSLTDIQHFVALRPAPKARASGRSVIELVYIGADDCSMCRRWEATYLGKGKLAGSADWPHLLFTEVKLATLKDSFRREDLPERLRPRFDGLMAEGLRIHGIPSFVLLVNGEYRAQALGPAAFESFVYPALRAAVKEKLAKP
jgi:hypothetical protein